jgi:hypothetical protein
MRSHRPWRRCGSHEFGPRQVLFKPRVRACRRPCPECLQNAGGTARNRGDVSRRSRSANSLGIKCLSPEVARHHQLKNLVNSVSIPVARSTLRSRFRRRVPTVAQSAKVGCLRQLRELRVASQPSSSAGFSALFPSPCVHVSRMSPNFSSGSRPGWSYRLRAPCAPNVEAREHPELAQSRGS